MVKLTKMNKNFLGKWLFGAAALPISRMELSNIESYLFNFSQATLNK